MAPEPSFMSWRERRIVTSALSVLELRAVRASPTSIVCSTGTAGRAGLSHLGIESQMLRAKARLDGDGSHPGPSVVIMGGQSARRRRRRLAPHRSGRPSASLSPMPVTRAAGSRPDRPALPPREGLQDQVQTSRTPIEIATIQTMLSRLAPA
jgi:hypothetical protein